MSASFGLAVTLKWCCSHKHLRSACVFKPYQYKCIKPPVTQHLGTESRSFWLLIALKLSNTPKNQVKLPFSQILTLHICIFVQFYFFVLLLVISFFNPFFSPEGLLVSWTWELFTYIRYASISFCCENHEISVSSKVLVF